MSFKLKLVKVLFNSLVHFSSELVGKLGYQMFSMSPKIAIKPHHQDFFNTSEQIVITSHAKKVRIYKWGTGDKKVLLLHGWASSSFWWRHHIRTLVEAGFTVYAMDAPGNGLSEGVSLTIMLYADAVKELYKQTSTFELVAGHSFGGFVSMYLTFILGEEFTKKVAVLGAPDKATLFFDNFSDTIGFSSKTKESIIQEFTKRFGHPPSYFDTSRFCKSIASKGLIIHDKQDEDTPFQCAENLSKAWPEAKFLITEDLGHALKSEIVYQEVLKFALE
jgi:pimeloyl-ACP methyl ester carboxylesterase